MIKKDLIEEVIYATDLDRSTAAKAVEIVINTITDALVKGDNVYLRGFATFKNVIKSPKKGQNIKGGYTIDIPARRSVKLILSPELKNAMNNTNTDN